MVDKRRNLTHISQPPGWGRTAAAIVALSVRQHGNVIRGQLLELGLGASAIDRSARGGRLHRVHAGVYAVGRPPVTALERDADTLLAGVATVRVTWRRMQDIPDQNAGASPP